ncbi:epidermal retinol dehydrogenase 2-like [Diadema antillarum]|uniref:epidermal retinol dehydrogenase 2-like n=1 Tax=Diadema antillarum TaxID=105358 RepID=UPI003A86DDCA
MAFSASQFEEDYLSDKSLPLGFFHRSLVFLIELIVLAFRVLFNVTRSLYRFVVPASPKYVYGRTVLITGSANGLGRLLAEEFANRGAQLVLLDIDMEGNRELASELCCKGRSAHPYYCDLSRRTDLYSVVAEIKRDIGNIDILINNAATLSGKPVLQCSEDAIEKVLEVNTMAYIWLIKAFLPDMLKRNQGHVVNIASLAGFVGVNGLADYCASKSAIIGFTEALSYELKQMKKSGVHLSLVCPSYMEEGMFAGCKSRFPAPLKSKRAVEMIVQGILTNQERIFVPWYAQYIPAVKSFLPVRAFTALLDFSGGGGVGFLRNFKGPRTWSG